MLVMQRHGVWMNSTFIIPLLNYYNKNMVTNIVYPYIAKRNPIQHNNGIIHYTECDLAELVYSVCYTAHQHPTFINHMAGRITCM